MLVTCAIANTLNGWEITKMQARTQAPPLQLDIQGESYQSSQVTSWCYHITCKILLGFTSPKL